jgi:hypothetical protein
MMLREKRRAGFLSVGILPKKTQSHRSESGSAAFAFKVQKAGVDSE